MDQSNFRDFGGKAESEENGGWLRSLPGSWAVARPGLHPRSSPAPSGAVMQAREPVVLPPAKFHKPSGLTGLVERHYISIRLGKMLWLACALLAIGSDAAHAAEWDLVVRHALIVDGTGKPAVPGELAVRGGRIAALGSTVAGAGTREIDAGGLVLAPGFVDVHTHAEDILRGPDAVNFVRMGVTTVIVGNCGASLLDVAGFFRDLESAHPAINVGTLVGHNAVRGQVMGSSFMRPPTDDELAKMRGLLEKAMRDGAMGLSSGLIYLPGKYAQTEELIDLAKVAARHHGLYASHVRDEQAGLPEALQEAFRIGREAGLPVELSHLKLSGNLIQEQPAETVAALDRAKAAGLTTQVVEALAAARRSGLRVTQDLYGYSSTYGFLERLLPKALQGETPEALGKRLADPATRTQLAADMKAELLAAGRTDYSHVVLVNPRRYRSLKNLGVPEATRQRRGTDSLDAQIDLMLGILQNGGATIILYEMSEDELRPLLQLPETMIASDSGAFQGSGELRHPRNYGSAARILARYVRTEKLLPLPEAVRKMTSLPATTFQIKDRGELRVGAWADLVIFDPATVQDRSTYAAPNQPATGFRAVIVNGVVAAENDAQTTGRGGRPVRRGQ